MSDRASTPKEEKAQLSKWATSTNYEEKKSSMMLAKTERKQEPELKLAYSTRRNVSSSPLP